MKTLLCLLHCSTALLLQAAVYELQLVVTTSTPTEAKVKTGANFCGEEGAIVYRKPQKMKISGLIWGTGCEADQGAVLWNETLKTQYAGGTAFGWDFLNRIGQKGMEAEGLWSADLYFSSGAHAGYLYGAGTGKIKKPDQISLSGNFAGYMYAGQVVKETRTGVCKYCSETTVTVLEALAWGVCDCGSVANDHTAAHGTWSMKYNATATRKYDESGDIAAAYRFPSYVRAE